MDLNGREISDDLVATLQKLAAGEFEPDEWLAWWQDNSEWLSSHLNRGEFIRLKPPNPSPNWGTSTKATHCSHMRVCDELRKWGVPFTQSDRYEKASEEEFAEYCRKAREEEKRRKKEYVPRLDTLGESYPELASFLRQNMTLIDHIAEPATDTEIKEHARQLGISLPISYVQLLRCTRELTLWDTVRVGISHSFVYPADAGILANRICLGDFFWRADGDQVVLGEVGTGADEADILYYAHEAAPPELRPLADSFGDWLESLPGSGALPSGI